MTISKFWERLKGMLEAVVNSMILRMPSWFSLVCCSHYSDLFLCRHTALQLSWNISTLTCCSWQQSRYHSYPKAGQWHQIFLVGSIRTYSLFFSGSSKACLDRMMLVSAWLYRPYEQLCMTGARVPLLNSVSQYPVLQSVSSWLWLLAQKPPNPSCSEIIWWLITTMTNTNTYTNIAVQSSCRAQ